MLPTGENGSSKDGCPYDCELDLSLGVYYIGRSWSAENLSSSERKLEDMFTYLYCWNRVGIVGGVQWSAILGMSVGEKAEG